MKRIKKDNMEGQTLFDVILIVFFIGLLFVIGISIILGIIFFGLVGIFHVFGGYYDSFWSLLLFLGIFWVVGIVIDLLCIFIVHSIKPNLNRVAFILVRLIVDCSGTLYALQIADERISSVELSFIGKVVCALILFLVEVGVTPKNPFAKTKK